MYRQKSSQKNQKNTPQNIDLNLISYQYFEDVDLYAIEGSSHGTLLTLMSELGEKGIFKFQNAQHFSSWLRLAPNNKIFGGRILINRAPKRSNSLKIELRQAANLIGNLKDTHLSNLFNRKEDLTPFCNRQKNSCNTLYMLFKNQQYNPPKIYKNIDQKRKKYVNFKNKLLV